MQKKTTVEAVVFITLFMIYLGCCAYQLKHRPRRKTETFGSVCRAYSYSEYNRSDIPITTDKRAAVVW